MNPPAAPRRRRSCARTRSRWRGSARESVCPGSSIVSRIRQIAEVAQLHSCVRCHSGTSDAMSRNDPQPGQQLPRPDAGDPPPDDVPAPRYSGVIDAFRWRRKDRCSPWSRSRTPRSPSRSSASTRRRSRTPAMYAVRGQSATRSPAISTWRRRFLSGYGRLPCSLRSRGAEAAPSSGLPAFLPAARALRCRAEVPRPTLPRRRITANLPIRRNRLRPGA